MEIMAISCGAYFSILALMRNYESTNSGLTTNSEITTREIDNAEQTVIHCPYIYDYKLLYTALAVYLLP